MVVGLVFYRKKKLKILDTPRRGEYFPRMRAEKKRTKTINVDAKIYDEFSKFCRDNGYKVIFEANNLLLRWIREKKAENKK